MIKTSPSAMRGPHVRIGEIDRGTMELEQEQREGFV
jgi:hypothetical protein